MPRRLEPWCRPTRSGWFGEGLAREFRVHHTTVRRLLDRAGVVRRKVVPLTEAELSSAVRLYDEGLTIAQVGRSLPGGSTRRCDEVAGRWCGDATAARLDVDAQIRWSADLHKTGPEPYTGGDLSITVKGRACAPPPWVVEGLVEGALTVGPSAGTVVPRRNRLRAQSVPHGRLDDALAGAAARCLPSVTVLRARGRRRRDPGPGVAGDR